MGHKSCIADIYRSQQGRASIVNFVLALARSLADCNDVGYMQFILDEFVYFYIWWVVLSQRKPQRFSDLLRRNCPDLIPPEG